MNIAKAVTGLLLCALLGIAGLHTLMTGSPSPLWHIEELENPQQVAAVLEAALELEDEREIRLPYIRTLPTGNALFRKAIEHGVEIGPDGEVTGLLKVERICGNDPVVYRRLRVNLSDLAGVLNPSGIDDTVVPPDVIDSYEEEFAHVTEFVRVDAHLLQKLRKIRAQIEFSVGTPSEKTEHVRGGSG